MTLTQHVMLDIETLDTTARSVVISIGAVAFTFKGGQQAMPFYRMLQYDEQIKMGRGVSESTLKFWSQQSDEARAAAFQGVRTPTAEVLVELTDWLITRAGIQDQLIWAYPASFDLAIMEDLYTEYGITIPWGHRDKRCARTLAALAGNPSFSHMGIVVPHHPVSDCEVQITQALKAVNEIKRIGVNIS